MGTPLPRLLVIVRLVLLTAVCVSLRACDVGICKAKMALQRFSHARLRVTTFVLVLFRE